MLLDNLPKKDLLLFRIAIILIIIIGVKLIGGLIGPLIIALFAAIIFSIISNWLQKKGLSIRVSNTLSFILFLTCIFGLILIIGLSITPLLK